MLQFHGYLWLWKVKSNVKGGFDKIINAFVKQITLFAV
jgi:hypothetical protein